MTSPAGPRTIFDAIVIGAGHNGLTAAAYLARAGQSVAILEKREAVGGMAGTAVIEPQFRVSHCAHVLGQLHPQIIRDLNLYKQGLKFTHRRLPTTGIGLGGQVMDLSADPSRGRGAPLGLSDLDAAALPAFMRQMRQAADLIMPLATADPDWGGPSATDALRLMRQSLKRFQDSDIRDTLSLLTMRLSDLLDLHFETPALKGILAFDALLGTSTTPRSPGTVLPWLYRLAGECSGVKGALGHIEGGMGALTEALLTVARERGVQLVTGTGVARITVEAGRASGVVTEDGRELKARTVFSSLDPVTTYTRLVGEALLDVDTARRLARWRATGWTAKVNIALDGLPSIPGVSEDAMGGRLLLAPDMARLDAAARPVKHGQMSTDPGLEVMIPSLHDASLAPAGKHVLSAVVQPVPLVGDADNALLREQVRHVVTERLSALSPDFDRLVRTCQVLTPRDLETEFGAPGGHWHHGEIGLDQLWSQRPAPGSGAPDPVPGLVLCGAGSHPGGGVTGVPGYRAARGYLSVSEAAA